MVLSGRGFSSSSVRLREGRRIVMPENTLRGNHSWAKQAKRLTVTISLSRDLGEAKSSLSTLSDACHILPEGSSIQINLSIKPSSKAAAIDISTHSSPDFSLVSSFPWDSSPVEPSSGKPST
jgi:hypothetical protein